MQKKLIVFLIFLFSLMTGRLSYIVFLDNSYDEKLKEKTEILVYGPSAPRGKILDINGKVIVDNEKVNTIFYHKTSNVTTNDELTIAEELAKYIDVTKVIGKDILKKYWLAKNKIEQIDLITDEEYKLLEERKISLKDIEKLKYERITDDMLVNINPSTAYFYYKMNDGANYANKILYEGLSDDTFAQLTELNLPGIFGDFTWKRVYPYEEALRSILGSVGSIPQEKKNFYLSSGYEITDIVGTSYLELQYEEYLKGEKAIYEVGNNNKLILKNEAVAGNDLVLSIDIEKQVEIEKILKEKILNAKSEPNTNYYKESYAIVSDPNNGSIIAMSGKRLIKKDSWQDITSNIINSSFTVGSVVKGATIAVGYQNNIIDIGTKMNDSCVKLYSVPQKCSFKKLGVIDDKTALMNSSNYYQFQIAIGLTGNKYKYNMKLNATEEQFKIYRETLASFGLGSLTEIDLPNEQQGIKGKTIADDLLLNLAIGQYDTYTPIQIVQYINTIANGGKKYAPRLMDKITNNNETILNKNNNYISTVSLEEKYINRIREGMNLVLMKGTGRGHVNYDLNPAGKTGTSESFYDSDNDNISDIKTVTKVFAGFIPYDNPVYSVVVISPNVSFDNPQISYTSNVNRHITRAITDFLFEI
ncbi:MAG: penicillin-binding protein 2 [Bacilli bacterium]|nr:penicillin-binding protein 2 [Bacilli bacterium]